MMITCSPPDIPVHVLVVTTERALGNVIHTRLLEQGNRK
jgi:hypothetical protein